MTNLAFIEAYDFSHIVSRLQAAGTEAGPASAACEQLRQFLSLRAMYPATPLTAWESMDSAWHAFLEDDGEYAAFCDAAFGAPAVHDADVFGTADFWVGWTNSCALMMKHFGVELETDRSAARQSWNAAAGCMLQPIAA
ncbi:glycine-rich domain-containing protein [Azospirillum agricola]|uniref:hypothetical protein n=1 Tax=Azospirillum agricola TaxID=1720247 RepID=UPI000A0F386F|nr:hypothetical protein [Azospirillum agricola]SMH56710.1 hypothetical protein SAMN02982994_4143 [Azospirillum lipoferum]